VFQVGCRQNKSLCETIVDNTKELICKTAASGIKHLQKFCIEQCIQ